MDDSMQMLAEDWITICEEYEKKLELDEIVKEIFGKD